MAQATGAKSRVIAVTETTYNEIPATPDAELIYIQTFTLKPSAAREQDPTLSGFRGQARGTLGRREVAGQATVSLAPGSIGFWLKHLIGAPATTGSASPYTHTFSLANPLPAGITFEVDYGAAIAAPGRYMRYSGCRVNQAQFQFQTQGTPSATIDLLGSSSDGTIATSLDATPTDPGHAAWGVSNLALVLDGGTTEVCLESLNVTWSNDLDGDLWCINNGGQRHGLPEGFAIVTGDGVAQFDTPVLLNKALNDQDLAIQVSLTRGTGAGTAGNESLVITIPLSTIDQTAPEISGPRGLKMPFNFVAHRTTGELGVTAVLKNQRATI
ncbi:phage tail tube protein [Xanthomonas sp. CFBP 7698]|uniref:phage tail tube protein n=1 Tax=Xanthomonas sp. CFBP 7698 TaxID=2082399 RepID=UPI000EC85545|nr:phage tail tube protein [Xanthomonas sp. CFBP 7698]RJS04874.1 hypothetical protein XnspCFBP7698_01020 [Xanthomonas sp. CFBP 7698]